MKNKLLSAKLMLAALLSFNTAAIPVAVTLEAPAAAVAISSAVSMPATVAAVGTCAIIALPFVLASCSKDQLVAAAEDVLAVITNAELMDALRTISPPLLARLESLVPEGKKLVAAIRNGDITTALGIVNLIFPVIDDVANALNASPRIKAIAAFANIALHFIINHARTTAAAAAQPSSPAIRAAIALSARPVWGCGLRNELPDGFKGKDRAAKRCAELGQ